MSVQHEQIKQSEQEKTPPMGGVGRPDFKTLFSRKGAVQEPPPGDEGGVEGNGESPGNTENLLAGIADDSSEIEGSAGGGENEGDEIVYEFSGVKYTPEQVEEALREKDNNQRYNQSVQPLIESINEYSSRTEQAITLATIECDRVIGELNKALSGGNLTPQQYQSAHMQMRDVQAKKVLLESEAKEAYALRDKALKQARAQNARQTITTLTKAGWTKEKIVAVDAFAQKVMNKDAYIAALSPAMLEVLNDAMIYRQGREAAAKKLQAKTKTALKTPANTQKAQPATRKRTAGEIIFGGKK